MASAEQQIQFLNSIQRVLDEGQFTSTYKYALLLAIADICVEEGNRAAESELEIPVERIAEMFVTYYWRQSAPYTHPGGDPGGHVLLQNPKKQAEIVSQLKRERDRHGEALLPLLHDQRSRERIVRGVAKVVGKMPLDKLQNVGSGKEMFLYDDSDVSKSIKLLSGVCYCFRTHHTLIRNLVRGAWLHLVRRLNGGVLGEEADLHDFMFGGERTLLTPVRPLLRELQQDKCFYCGERLTGQKVEVDHFIPWSRYPVDLGHNFVLADERCNRNKSDTLAATAHLEHWLDQIQRSPVELDSAFAELMIPMNRGRSVRIANWAYSRDYERKAMMWLRATEMLRLDEGWNRALAALLN